MHYIYLHGFASSPNSAKARYMRDRFAEVHINLRIPDLNANDFFRLTITRQITQIASEISRDSTPVTLVGSSLGGLTSAHLGQQYQQVQRLVLLAPAFGFLSHWLPQLGNEQRSFLQQEKYLMIYHYGEKRVMPLGYEFFPDAAQYQDEMLQRPISTLIIHGQHDEVIPIQASRDFARSRPWVELVELDSNHSLENVMGEIWQLIRSFCQIP